jgi:cytochrome c551/c552
MIDRRGGHSVTTHAQALAAAARVVGRAWADVARLYPVGGATAIAEAARELGGPSRQEIASKYEGFVQEENACGGAGGP